MEAFKGLLGLAVVGVIIYAANSDDYTSTNTDTVAGLEQHTQDVIKDGKATSAIAYNDFVVGLQVGIAKCFDELNANEDESRNMELLNKCESTAKNAVSELKRIEPYSGGIGFRDATMENFQIYVELAETVSAIQKGETSAEIITALATIEARIQASDSRVALAQRSFANTHGMGLEENAYELEQQRKGNR